MFRTVLAGALSLALAVHAAAAPALATLVIKVEKVSPRGGDVRVALYDAATYNDDTGDRDVGGAVVAAKPGETIVTLTGIKPGTYAVKLFQDFNRNGKFDMTWYGLPAEKYGFSNDARPTLSEPSFDATKFEVRPGENVITVTLR